MMIKITFGDDIRRVRLQPFKFDTLITVIQQIYNIEDSSVIRITYKDEDEDMITVSNTNELLEAQEVMKSIGSRTLKLFLYKIQKESKDRTSDHEVKQEPQSKNNGIHKYLDIIEALAQDAELKPSIKPLIEDVLRMVESGEKNVSKIIEDVLKKYPIFEKKLLEKCVSVDEIKKKYGESRLLESPVVNSVLPFIRAHLSQMSSDEVCVNILNGLKQARGYRHILEGMLSGNGGLFGCSGLNGMNGFRGFGNRGLNGCGVTQINGGDIGNLFQMLNGLNGLNGFGGMHMQNNSVNPFNFGGNFGQFNQQQRNYSQQSCDINNKEDEFKYSKELNTLKSVGFNNTVLNKVLLTESEGDVSKVINTLIALREE